MAGVRRLAAILEHLLILDFEATCEQSKIIHPQEIIEFPCFNLRTADRTVQSRFHSYVRPTARPVLTSFCTQLTGIVQAMVDDQPDFVGVKGQFDQWLADQRLPPAGRWAFCTFGDWDLNTMLPGQCAQLGLPVDDHFRRWVNVKKIVYTCTLQYPLNLLHAMQLLGLEMDGRLHSGIDDVRNICRLVCELLKRGQRFSVTGGGGVDDPQ